jgi:D-glycero-D-manno-heptose 1,7-bisphosphate phosphatase
LIKTIFLDRDGIINDVVLRDSKVESPRTVSEFKIRPEFINFYKEIDTGGFNLFVISNQPDIARNKMDIKELEIMTEQIPILALRKYLIVFTMTQIIVTAGNPSPV